MQAKIYSQWSDFYKWELSQTWNVKDFLLSFYQGKK